MNEQMFLIVDDHADTCRALKRLLNRSGFPAECASGGEEALTFLKSHRPKLIVLDEMMPQMSGMDVLRQMRADPQMKDLQVVFYSASTDPEKRQQAIQMGAVDWLTKGATNWPDLLGKLAQYYHDTPGEAAPQAGN
jgi:CheY-like chemotaxis protein